MVADVVLNAMREPMTAERSQHQMFETLNRKLFEEFVVESFGSVFFAGIEFQAFLMASPTCSAMGSKASVLADALSAVGFKEFNVYTTFPFFSALIIVACP